MSAILFERVEQLLRQHRRQTERGLVEHQNVRPGHECAADRHHLLLAARHRAYLLALAFSKAREEIVDKPERRFLAPARALRESAECEFSATVSSPNTPRPSGTSAIPCSTTRCASNPGDHAAVHADFGSRFGWHDAGDRLQKAGFSGAVRAEHDGDFAFADVQGHAFKA